VMRCCARSNAPIEPRALRRARQTALPTNLDAEGCDALRPIHVTIKKSLLTGEISS
jgi:hypothetical protein